jgi:hypothetical protein
MNSHLYIFGNDNMLITVNGIFLGNAATPITFVTEENALLYFWVMPFDDEFKPFAFSLKIGRNMGLPQEFGYIVSMPARRYEIRLNAPKYPELVPPPASKIIKTLIVKSNNPKNNIAITDEGAHIQNDKTTLPKIMPDTIKHQSLENNSEKQTNSPTLMSEVLPDLPEKQPVQINESSGNSSLVLNPKKSTSKTSAQKSYKVSLIEDLSTRLKIECPKDVFYHNLPHGLNNINLKSEIVNNELVTCVTAEENESYKTLYLLIIKGTQGKYQVKIEDFVDRIAQEGKKITTLKFRGDIACRGFITVFDGQTFEKTEEYYVYCKGEPIHTTDNRLMPMAVFEAVKCKDFIEARYYMTDSLNDILTPEKLENFFDDYQEIIPNNYYSQYPHSFILIDKNNSATLFNAVYKSNKIDNFTEIEF